MTLQLFMIRKLFANIICYAKITMPACVQFASTPQNLTIFPRKSKILTGSSLNNMRAV